MRSFRSEDLSVGQKKKSTPTYGSSETNGMTDSGSKRVYLDSNALIYAVEGVPGTAVPAKKLIAFLRDRRGSMFTSEIALAEVLAPSKRQGAWPLPAKKRAYLDLLIWGSAVTLAPVVR